MMKILKILCAFRGKKEDRRISIELVKMEKYVLRNSHLLIEVIKARRHEPRLFGISDKLSDDCSSIAEVRIRVPTCPEMFRPFSPQC